MVHPRNNNPALNAELQAVEQQFVDEVAAIDAPNQIHYDSEYHGLFAQREERKRIIYAGYGLLYKKKRYMDYYTIEYREEPENYPRANESYPGFNAFENWEAAAGVENGAASVGTADPNAASELEGNALSQVGVNDEFLAEFQNENNAESVYSTNSNVSNNNPTPLKRKRGNRYNNNNNNNRRTRRHLFQEPTAPAGGRRKHRHTKKCNCRNNRKTKRSMKDQSVKRRQTKRHTHRAPRK